jgi:hypothetical protein
MPVQLQTARDEMHWISGTMDPSRTIRVTFSGHEVHEVGAVLVTVLAHPGDGDRARSNLYASLWACVLRAQLGPC